jgi:hypothetical protein
VWKRRLRLAKEQLPKGVVLDEPMLHALLSSAVREGLLDSDPTVGDGFVRQIMRGQPRPDLTENAYEHLVLGGRVFAPWWLPRGWRGELAERELIVQTGPARDEDLVEAPGLSPGLALAMLRDRGQFWSRDDLVRRYEDFMAAFRAWEATGGKSFEALQILMTLKDTVGVPSDEYTPEQLSAWQTVSAAYGALRPVLYCHRDYRRVLTSSLQNGALSGLPLDPATASASALPLPTSSQGHIVLLRVACKQLRRVPIGSTLRETVAIAASPEAHDMRHKLVQWTNVIRRNQADPAATVLRDVERARASLKTSRTLARVGEYTTIIGVPAGVAGVLLMGPLVAIGGLAISVVGGVALGGQKLVERINRWAMYGQV